MGDTQDKTITKKNSVIMILGKRKVNNAGMLFYLKAECYAPERQVAHTNIPEDKKVRNEEKDNGKIS